jgi:protein involved in polysaccharide export with SLBB domain
MRCQLFCVSVMSLSVLACQPRASSAPAGGSTAAATAPCCQYVVSGGALHPGRHELRPGDTVSKILACELPAAPGKPVAIVLIRQGPEGKTQRRIQLDARGRLMDEKQNWALRNGDELVFPGGGGSNSTRNPTGPPAHSAN